MKENEMARIKISKSNYLILSSFAVIFATCLLPVSVNAQLFNSSKEKTNDVYNPVPKSQNQPAQSVTSSKMDNVVLGHVKTVTLSCVQKWEDQGCMKALSSMNMTFASTYASTLQNANKKSYTERLKNGCAASTAALKVVVPAYAMRSAMVECVNVMSDIADKASVRPDPSLSQLSVGAILCLGKDKSCKKIEQGLLAAVSSN